MVEDSERLRFSLGQALRKSGYSVDLVGDGKEGFDYAFFNTYDVIVLDLMLPGMDGLTLLRKLRAAGKDTHVLILSARDQVEDRVKGLEIGADDYMIKPFSFDELHARLRTLLRRKSSVKSPKLKVGPLLLNLSTKEVKKDDVAIDLTAGEYSIFECLVLNRGKVMSKEQLLDAVHDSDSFPCTNVIEVMVCKIRGKLEAAVGESLIKTRRGYGYYVEAGAIS